MASGFGELTQQANALVAAGNLAGARDLLGPPLDGADPSPGHASPELAEAAGLQARVLVALGDPHAARGWAAFAYSAATRLYGSADQRTVATAATLAAVLHRVGSHERATGLYRDVIIELTATDGPESLRVLAAHADLATVEYAQGECTLARNRLEDAWELHREVYGDGHPAGIRMLARLGAMQRDCGLFTEAHEHLALARELCREHLSADHPLATQIGALGRAAANPDHLCADTDPPHSGSAPPHHGPPPQHAMPPAQHTGPAQQHAISPPAQHPGAGPQYPGAGSGPVPHAAPFQAPPGHPEQPYQGVPPAGFPLGAEHPPDAELPPREESPPSRYPAPPQSSRSAGPAIGPPQVPPPRLPPAPLVEPPTRWATPPPAGAAIPPPRTSTSRAGSRFGTGPDSGTDEDHDPEHDWWPPDVARRTPDGEDDLEDEPTGLVPDPEHRWRTDTFSGPPSVVPALAASAAPHREPPDGFADEFDEADGVRRVRHLPVPRSSRLPVRIHRPQPSARRLPMIVVAGLVVLVLLGTVVVVLGFGLTEGDDPAPPPSEPTTGTPAGPPGTPPPASPGTPPGSVTLADNRSSVTLAWTYPTGAEGPVVVAGGRAGQELRAFEELPAGSTGYVVYGLENQGNYCFSVSVVYSAGLVGRADPVCTDRPGSSPSAR